MQRKMEFNICVFLLICSIGQGLGYKCYNCQYRVDEGCGPRIDSAILQNDNKIKYGCAACATYSTHVTLSNATVYRYCVPFTEECRQHEKLCSSDLCNGDAPGLETGRSVRIFMNSVILCLNVILTRLILDNP